MTKRNLLHHMALIVTSLLLLLLSLLTTKLPVFVSGAKNPKSRNIAIVNESGRRIEVHWISFSGELVLQSSPHVLHGATLPLDSYIGHNFQVRELPHSRTGKCGDGEGEGEEGGENVCRVGYFSVSQNDDQVVYVRKGMVVEHMDNIKLAQNQANDLMEDCEHTALSAIDSDSDASMEDIIHGMLSCVGNSVTEKLSNANEEISFQAKIREDMSNLLENYTCVDEGLPTTEPAETRHWRYKGVTREVKVMHNRASSKIHVIKNFISEEECDAMEKAAVPGLHRATVADEDGGSKFSESRKAMQAGIAVPWEKEDKGHPIAVLSRRVFDYTNDMTGYDLKEFGQEELMSIQYKGRGDTDAQPDRYMPHCDGDCTGLPFRDGTRVATMVMYCTIPEIGGATNFMNAGVHVVPEKGSAVFFSYMSPETKIMDNGFTRHSGCPVIKGDKKIVTQWMRMGVSVESPWDSYNTLGIKFSEAQD